MAGGEGGLVPDIEQRDFLAQQQRGADLEGVTDGKVMNREFQVWIVLP